MRGKRSYHEIRSQGYNGLTAEEEAEREMGSGVQRGHRGVWKQRYSRTKLYCADDLGYLMCRKPVSVLLLAVVALVVAWCTVLAALVAISAVQVVCYWLGAVGVFAKQLIVASIAVIALG